MANQVMSGKLLLNDVRVLLLLILALCHFRLENKPPMPYRIWTAKLSVIVRQWYKALSDSGRDLTKVNSLLSVYQ